MRPRVLADLIAARKNKPYINGGVKGLVAQYMEFSSTNLVQTYGAPVAKDTSVVSCQEDGDVPVSSNSVDKCPSWCISGNICSSETLRNAMFQRVFSELVCSRKRDIL